jgi:ribosome-associated toxin RatA of RatAB toxin-antitoxin module
MTILHNEIAINASPDKVWSVLTDITALEKYDPTVLGSDLVSTNRNGIGATRKVRMKDGKNWFVEKVTGWEQGKALSFQLTDCSFPINSLSHSYSFSSDGTGTTVRQVMTYEVKFGMLGKFMDRLMIRKQTDKGIKLFMGGLKNFVEAK